jgi:hexosaminidase
MKRLLLLLSVSILLASCNTKQATPEAISRAGSIVPKPLSVKVGDKAVHWNESVNIIAETDEEKKEAIFLESFFKLRKISASVVSSADEPNAISLIIANTPDARKDGYLLISDENGVMIKGNTAAGLFYGTQTFMQMVSADGKEIAYASVTDYPRFDYRGLMLDVGRHMYPVSFIKKYIDLLAYHKFNRFHWHFTEDQGWRIEIKKYPKLQEVGAYRDQTVMTYARTKDRPFLKPSDYDGKRYGGYYTQTEIKDVVQYAADRHVTVIPEIEMPGHAMAALASYPDLGCTGGPYKTAMTWGIFDDVFCAGKEETFVFLQEVLDEVIPLFPGEYIHIGGDECPKVKWEKCSHCKKRMKEENLKDTHELQRYFIQRMEKYVNSKGKKIIGWDEILEGGLAPNATVMSWRGEDGGIAAAKQSHTVIMSPTDCCYFDYQQDTSKSEPMAIKKYLPVKTVYSYEPIPTPLTTEESKYVLGAQANVWSEYLKTSEQVEYMTYPRASAMAEVVWSAKENRDYSDFLKRMSIHMKRLDELKVNAAKHISREIKN